MKLIRTIYLGLALSIGTIFAHHFAGGDFVESPQFFAVAVTTFAIGALLSRTAMEGPGLASAIVMAQIFGHFALTANYQSSILMYLSHILLGVITYFALGYVERLAKWAFESLTFIFRKFFEIRIEEREFILSEYRSVLLLKRSIVRYWSPAPPDLRLI